MTSAPPFVFQSPSATERRLSFRVGDSWCTSTRFDAGAGTFLNVTACRYDPTFAFSVVHPPAELELVVSRGAVIPALTEQGETVELGGNAFEVSRVRRALPLSMRPVSAARTDIVSVSLSAARLRELLGTAELPATFRELMAAQRVREVRSQALTPPVLRLFDEIVGERVRGPGRTLWHQAKTLELVALLTDEFAAAAECERPRLTPGEVERVEGVRRQLVAHLQSPPALVELARAAAMSETKLKGAFRALYDTSVFACLRQARMDEARRLLGEERVSVTEVAQRVGYANPSKFAAAFRRQYGRSPSEI